MKEDCVRKLLVMSSFFWLVVTSFICFIKFHLAFTINMDNVYTQPFVSSLLALVAVLKSESF